MSVSLQQMCCDHVNYDINVRCWLCLSEVLVSSAKADLTLQDAHRNTALHLACSKVPNTRSHTSNTHLLYTRAALQPDKLQELRHKHAKSIKQFLLLLGG